MQVAIKEIDLEKTINKAAKETAEEVISLLKNNRMINDSKNYYKKVEKILYNYNNLKEAIKEKDEEIEELKQYGLREKSKSVTMYGGSGGIEEDKFLANMERYQEKMARYEYEKKEIIRYLARIDRALNKIKKSKYYKIIELKYLKPCEINEKRISNEELAKIFDVDRRTIERNKSKLINNIATILFPEHIMN